MKKILALCLLLITFNAKSQIDLSISPYDFTIYNDSIIANSIDSADIFVVNNSSTLPFNDDLEIHISVQDSMLFTYHPVDTLHFPALNIPPSDSVSLRLIQQFIISPTKYHYDINVIVIWPYAPSTGTGDSLNFPIFITLPDGINDINLENLITAYPNPAADQVMISNATQQRIIEVRIFGMSGQQIPVTMKDGMINTEGWSRGNYLARIRLSGGKEISLRIIKK
jgi:hypothetical protein